MRRLIFFFQIKLVFHLFYTFAAESHYFRYHRLTRCIINCKLNWTMTYIIGQFQNRLTACFGLSKIVFLQKKRKIFYWLTSRCERCGVSGLYFFLIIFYVYVFELSRYCVLLLLNFEVVFNALLFFTNFIVIKTTLEDNLKIE